MNAKLLKFGMNIWPPFLGAGIKVHNISADYKSASVSLKMGFLNTNVAGVHFGGSLFAMTDPFFMIMVQHNLGKEYPILLTNLRSFHGLQKYPYWQNWFL